MEEYTGSSTGGGWGWVQNHKPTKGHEKEPGIRRSLYLLRQLCSGIVEVCLLRVRDAVHLYNEQGDASCTAVLIVIP